MDKESVAKAILAQEKTALEAWNAGNPSGYLEIYHPDITYFDPMHQKRIDGWKNMQVYYESIRGKIKVEQYEIIDPQVEVWEETAVLTYNLFCTSEGVPYHWNCTEVYRLLADKTWKIIHNHWSLIQPAVESN